MASIELKNGEIMDIDMNWAKDKLLATHVVIYECRELTLWELIIKLFIGADPRILAYADLEEKRMTEDKELKVAMALFDHSNKSMYPNERPQWKWLTPYVQDRWRTKARVAINAMEEV